VNTLRKLDHPNVIKTHEVYEDDSSVYLVTDAYYGGTLAQRMEKKPDMRFSIRDCLEIIRKVLKGVDYVHGLNIIHRDIKPANIMLKDEDSSNDLVIIDFGFATLQMEYNKLFTSCGTNGYTAPEMLRKEPYDTKSDIFGVGVLFYQM
jgi:calcium/calmodulin-dependent protein kinase I